MKAVIYCRKSQESEDRQIKSLDAQKFELKKLAKEQGLEVVGMFCESMSAKAPGRPIFGEMIKQIYAGKADVILCWKLDRLARNPVDGGSVNWMIQSNLIKAIRTPEKTYLPTDNVLMMYVEFGMSNQYIRDLSANVKRGNREKLRRGEWPNRAPYGYLNDKSTKKIVLEKSQAKIVKKLYQLYGTGNYSFSQLAKKFNLRKNRVDSILSRTLYYGIIEKNGEFFPGIHQPIITKELYLKAQQAKIKAIAHRPRPKKQLFAYRGLLKCAECQCQYTASRKKKIYDYYYCTNGKSICEQHKSYLKEHQAESFIINALRDLKFDEELIEIMYQAASEKVKFEQQEHKDRIREINIQITKFSNQERKLLFSYIDEKVAEHLYQETTGELRRKIKELEKEKGDIERELAKQQTTLELTKKVFLDSNRAISDYLDAKNMKKKEIAQNVLWNLEVKDKKVLKTNYKSPYGVLAKAPKNGDLAMMLPD